MVSICSITYCFLKECSNRESNEQLENLAISTTAKDDFDNVNGNSYFDNARSCAFSSHIVRDYPNNV